MYKLNFLLLVLLGLSCNRKATFPVEPKITFNSMQPQIVNPGQSVGGTRITIYFEDGDGDIGFGTQNLFFKDSRDSSVIKLMIPEVPGEYSPNKGLKGNITVDFLSAWIAVRPDTTHISRDTLQWEIYMLDKAGHKSNTIITDTLFLMK